MRRLFESAYNIRRNPNSTTDELREAAEIINNALNLASDMEALTEDSNIRNEIIVDRLRCYIERIAIYTRLMKNAYNTPQFDELSQQQEEYYSLYKNIYSHIEDKKVQESQRQLTVMAYQSLAASYFRRGGMGKDKMLCWQAIGYLDKAMEITKGTPYYEALEANKQQILQAMGK
ncbi:MAG: hypothetical protein LBG19_02680 [Prevotellaceae bacterium]|nr:hypothetical protein [Prevotellaceae bacterium]